MTEVTFKNLQSLHESLLQKQPDVTIKNQAGFAKEVREYIEQAKQAGSYISSTRERDQIRANLRYWANYIYGIDGVFPNTELVPSTAVNDPSFWTGKLGLFILGLLLVIIIGIGSTVFSNNVAIATSTATSPSDLSLTQTISGTFTAEVFPSQEATATSVFNSAVLVALTSPENGANVLPKSSFAGISTNLKKDDSIHLLIIRDDRFFPITNFVTQGQISATGEWSIDASLYQNESELEKSENLIIVPSVCSDQQCRDTLAKAIQTGIPISPLPPQLSFNSFTVYRDSSRVYYRNAYDAVQGTRLVYSRIVETVSGDKPYDIFTANIDGSDIRQITFTSDIQEDWPNLSPDGTKIAYVHFDLRNGLYSIHIMNSNGQNDQEITPPQEFNLETPQWSPDGEYISYAIGNTARSANATYWSIHAYHLPTKEEFDVSGEEGALILNRYHAWLPNSNHIIFNASTRNTATSGFIKVPISDLSDQTLFFDTQDDEIQPLIHEFENGYILTYTIIRPVIFYHNIYAVVDTDQEFPFDGTPVSLTDEDYGADLPIFDQESSSIYYIGSANNIYSIPIQIDGNQIILVNGIGSIGDIVLESDPNERIADFDLGYMEAFFPISQTP